MALVGFKIGCSRTILSGPVPFEVRFSRRVSKECVRCTNFGPHLVSLAPGEAPSAAVLEKRFQRALDSSLTGSPSWGTDKNYQKQIVPAVTHSRGGAWGEEASNRLFYRIGCARNRSPLDCNCAPPPHAFEFGRGTGRSVPGWPDGAARHPARSWVTPNLFHLRHETNQTHGHATPRSSRILSRGTPRPWL